MNPALKNKLKPIFHFFATIGFDPRRIVSLRYFKKYLEQLSEFKLKGGRVTHRYPILTDYFQQAGSARGHYFHQDLLVASLIYKNSPTRHIDIGSRVDGFVAHVAAFRRIEVMDVRNLENCGHENISFLRVDLMSRDPAQIEMADSISCLHAIEHFGLGRYGDSIDPEGHKVGYKNILRMLKPEGTLYISFPIANKTRTYFNAHRVFHPKDILTWSGDPTGLKLERFDYVDDEGTLHQNASIDLDKIDLVFGCGIYTFTKNK